MRDFYLVLKSTFLLKLIIWFLYLIRGRLSVLENVRLVEWWCWSLKNILRALLCLRWWKSSYWSPQWPRSIKLAAVKSRWLNPPLSPDWLSTQLLPPSSQHAVSRDASSSRPVFLLHHAMLSLPAEVPLRKTLNLHQPHRCWWSQNYRWINPATLRAH